MKTDIATALAVGLDLDATILERVKPFTKSSAERLKAMNASLKYIDKEKILGDIVECGVWAGGNIILSRLVCPTRRIWLYDTFEGMTKPGPFDTKKSGKAPPPDKALSKKWTAVSAPQVMINLINTKAFNRELTNTVIGDVLETLKVEENLPKKIALLRLDTDWYESTKMELEVLWPRLVKGGVLIVDDYGHWLGCKKAVKEFFKNIKLDIKKSLKPIDYTAVMLVKQ